MKKVFLSFGKVLCVLLMIQVSVSCGSKKEVATVTPKSEGEQLMEVYCDGPEYQSTDEFYRASAVGESTMQMAAKQQAMTVAKRNLAASIKSHLEGVAQDYVNTNSVGNTVVGKGRFNSTATEIVDQELQAVRVICQKYTKTSNGTYKCYICVQMATEQIKNNMANRLSQEDELKLKFDEEQYRKIYEDKLKEYRENKR